MKLFSIILCISLLYMMIHPAAIAAEGSTIFCFECSYPCWSDAKGNHATSKKYPMEFKFVWKLGERNATMIGNVGTAEVAAIQNACGITFVEITNTGNVTATTINLEQIKEIKKNGILQYVITESVHSRNTIMPDGYQTWCQYYGTCVIKR